MLNRLIKITSSLPFLMVLGFWVSYLLFGYFAVNPISQRLLPWIAENKLASRLTVERVSYDPLRLAVTVNNLKLTTADGDDLAGFERLHTDLELSGLFRFAWRLKDIQLDAPHVNFEVTSTGSNWADLIAKLNENPKEESSGDMARLLIDHIKIARGDIAYADHNRAETFRAALEPLDLELDGFSTLPEDLGDYAIMAKLPEQGGTLKWKGELGLNPIVSSGKVELDGLKLSSLLKVLPPDALPVRLDEGLLKAQLDYQFSMPQEQPQVTVSHMQLTLDSLAAVLLQSQDQAGKVGLQQLQVDLPTLEYKAAPQTQVQLAGLKLGMNGLSLEQAGKPLFELPEMALEDVSLDLMQRKIDIGSLKLADGHLYAERAKDGMVDWQQLHVATADSAGATSEDTQQEDVQAESEPSQPFDITLGQFNIAGFKADYADHAFKHLMKVAVNDINLSLKLAGPQDAIVLDDIHAEVGKVSVASALDNTPAATLGKLEVQGGKVELAESKATLAAIVLSGLDTRVLRDSKTINWASMLEPATAQSDNKAEPAPAQPQSSSWMLDLKRLALADAAIHFEDKSTPTPVKLDIQQAAVEVKDISLDQKKALPVSLAFKVKQGGAFSSQGKIVPETLNGDFKLKLNQLSLKPFAPYVNQAALLKLNDGAVNIAGNLDLKQGKQLSLQYNGGFSVNHLNIVEEEGGQPFLGWKSLSTDNLRLSLAPDQLRIGELRITEPNGKFIIYEDRSLNVTRILRDQGSAAAPADTAPAAKDGEAFAVAVNRIRIDKAQLEFADLSLTPQFGTNIHSLSGVVNGLSSKEDATAQVELDGKVDEYGSARIRGSLQPFKATDFTDLKLVFRNLEMNRLTPYSGKFAGRRIDSGKLSVDLEYKIKQRQLAGENKFVVNKLRLGEQVSSEDAVNLPLDLAIALLEDSNGVIDLDLPVSGSLDDPEFSYGKIVWKAIVNVLGKIVTSPFRALGNLLGIGADQLEALLFDPGSAELAPPEQEKLKAISEALAKRPALILAVAPVIDDKVDGSALQEQFVRNQVAAQMGIKLEPGDKPGPVDVHSRKARAALERLAKEQLTAEVLDTIKAEKEEDVRYNKLLEALNQHAKLEPSWLEALANARAEVVQKYLQETLALAPEKLQIKPLVQQSGSDGEVHMPLELGAGQQE
ncbi:protein of unknown function [Methylobacillus rhizosphaerae]|uniref:DUF748 domain-containing protein n=1 Tax=Methylobacillus rhizosphaerae TaxID=551994 RepID=A0A238ZLQ5_9PROT|nr:DUF748 domain-containing protein [Methylobacillus rhizosphaerae]SNR83613.1 protein of unknown function [Methylobacillus rhizosphaerae]